MFTKIVNVITNYLTDYFDLRESFDDVGIDNLIVIGKYIL